MFSILLLSLCSMFILALYSYSCYCYHITWRKPFHYLNFAVIVIIISCLKVAVLLLLLYVCFSYDFFIFFSSFLSRYLVFNVDIIFIIIHYDCLDNTVVCAWAYSCMYVEYPYIFFLLLLLYSYPRARAFQNTNPYILYDLPLTFPLLWQRKEFSAPWHTSIGCEGKKGST